MNLGSTRLRIAVKDSSKHCNPNAVFPLFTDAIPMWPFKTTVGILLASL